MSTISGLVLGGALTNFDSTSATANKPVPLHITVHIGREYGKHWRQVKRLLNLS
jgi:hypothetical protein